MPEQSPIHVHHTTLRTSLMRVRLICRQTYIFTNLFQLPNTLQDAYHKIFGKSTTADVLAHCKRELVHAIWELLLDTEFMAAYKHGIVVMFADGIERRVYPRFVTYSADYPER